MLKIANLKFWILGLGAAALTACGGPEQNVELALNDLEVVLEGPLFEGPNQGQYTVKVDLKELMGDAYQDGMHVHAAKITSASVRANDSLGFAQVTSFGLSFASDAADVAMKEAAFANSIPSGAGEVVLITAPDAELGALVSGGTFYLVLDANLAEDYYDGNRSFLLNVLLNLTVKS